MLTAPPPYVLRRPLLSVVAAYALGLAAWRLWLPAGVPEGDVARFADGSDAVLAGRVAEDPDFRGDRFHFVLAVTARRGPGSSDGAVGGGDWRPARGRVRVTIDGPEFSAGWGDEIEVAGALFRPAPAAAPGGFDYRAFLAEKNVHALLRASPGGWRLARSAPPWSPSRWLGRARARFFSAFDRRLSPHAAALMSGLLLGKKPVSYPEMDRDFRRSGAYHLLVASGSNVGFVLGLWFVVGRWLLGLPRRPLWGLAIAWAFLYAGLAGADPPIVRAALMTALGITGALCAREDRLEHAVVFSLGALLLIRPRALFEAGFQMSYAATLGVVMSMPALDAVAARHGPGSSDGTAIRPEEKGARRRWIRLVRPLTVSVAAQLALAPLLIHYFHRLSWIGIFTNVFAVPWAAVCVAMAAGLFLLDVLCPGAALTQAGAWAAENAARVLWSGVALFARAPGAEVPLAWSPGQVLALGAAVAAVLLCAAAGFRGWRTALVVCLAAFPAWVWAGRPVPRGELAVTWLNAGLGDSAVVESPSGRVTVVDAGSAEAGTYRLAPYLRRRRIRRIDRLVLTHADPPHAGGLAALAAEFELGELICTEATWRSSVWSEPREALEPLLIPRRTVRAGDAWEDGLLRWRVLAPEAGDPSDPDSQSLVLLLEYGGTAALLSADVPAAGQRRAARSLPLLSVAQWPHHGKLKPFPDFLASGRPRWLVVSGQDAGEFAASFTLSGAVRVTGRDGSLRWTSDGASSRLEALSPPELEVYSAR